MLPSRFCSGAWKRWQSHGDEVPRYNNNQRRFFIFEITRHVKVFFWPIQCCLLFFLSVLPCVETGLPYRQPLLLGILLNAHKPQNHKPYNERTRSCTYTPQIHVLLSVYCVIRLLSAGMWLRVVWWKCSNISDELSAVIPKIVRFFEMSVYF
jgi:hypothetical protein